jgi:hypothetical protein
LIVCKYLAFLSVICALVLPFSIWLLYCRFLMTTLVYYFFFVASCMVLKETPVGRGGRTNAQITLRNAKYLHTIKYVLLHNFRENKPVVL